MIKLTSHRQELEDEFCQFRIEDLDLGVLGAGFLTLTLDEAQYLSAVIILGAKAAGIEVEYKETSYAQDRTRILANSRVDQ